MTHRNVDLDNGLHLERNAIEDHAFLTSRGVPHEVALTRVGHTEESWRLMHEAAHARTVRAARKEAA